MGGREIKVEEFIGIKRNFMGRVGWFYGFLFIVCVKFGFEFWMY